jgi:hypothetical protein
MAASQVTLPALLDEMQAAEDAGAEALGLWITACGDARLRGGLRVIRARDLAHARLARRRLAALGEPVGNEAPRQVQHLCGILAAPDVSNRSKLAILLSRFPARVDDPLPAAVRALDDAETRALLETVHDDDRASLRWLREMGDTGDAATAGVEAGGPAAPAVLRFLDAFRAAEEASAEVFGAWRVVCGLPGLRGGLETIAEREATHAMLLAERLEELGGAVRARVTDGVLEAARERFGATAIADEEKLARVLTRYTDDVAATAPLVTTIESDAIDGETREMLRLVGAGEAASFAWLRSYHRAIAERPREVSLRVLDGGR